MEDKPKRVPIVRIAAAICAVTIGLYAGCYFWLVKPITMSGMSFMTMGAANWKPWTVATYPTAIGNPKFWERFFAPANSIDRKLRPKQWEPGVP